MGIHGKAHMWQIHGKNVVCNVFHGKTNPYMCFFLNVNRKRKIQFRLLIGAKTQILGTSKRNMRYVKPVRIIFV